MLNYKTLKNAIQIICVFYLILMVYISFRLNMENRSLWQDEAMLSFSFFRRNIFNLTSFTFELNQSAPVLWLYIVKFITLIFGTSEFWLRFLSFISYISTLFCSWYILSRILKTMYPLLGTCVIAGLFQILRYSNEFKPYITDCTVTLVLIIIYFLYKKHKCNRSVLNTSYILSIWMSNPACFIIASLLVTEFITSIKNKKSIIPIIISGALVFISFITYFFYWLKPIMDEGYMKIYWANYRFSLMPDEIHNTLGLIKVILLDFSPIYWIIFILLSIGFFANILKFKNIYIHILYGAIVVSVFASAFGMNPLDPRICLWYYPVFTILVTFLMSKIAEFKKWEHYATVLMILFVLSTSKLVHYSNLKNNYRNYQEFNSTFEYVQKNITMDDTVYVFQRTYPVFLYKNKLDSVNIAPFKNNVVIGREQFDSGRNKADIVKLKAINSLYILIVHSESKYIEPLIDSLKIYGRVDTPYIQYGSPVIKYKRN